ncbi:hypothetical protein Cgig2_028497 [Carnegiea gigantea]|uniref:Uncharacterized protein n=1 Tax=Carnegiea gigantea TaxID=171969 RepID=A0A9Q1Q898_9CARY|nr:hypothetical protein Cgig2_028497 [Carnegiea gigantea]
MKIALPLLSFGKPNFSDTGRLAIRLPYINPTERRPPKVHLYPLGCSCPEVKGLKPSPPRFLVPLSLGLPETPFLSASSVTDGPQGLFKIEKEKKRRAQGVWAVGTVAAAAAPCMQPFKPAPPKKERARILSHGVLGTPQETEAQTEAKTDANRSSTTVTKDYGPWPKPRLTRGTHWKPLAFLLRMQRSMRVKGLGSNWAAPFVLLGNTSLEEKQLCRAETRPRRWNDSVALEDHAATTLVGLLT